MIGWLIFSLYCVGFVPSWWIIAGAMAWGMKFDRDPLPESGDWAPAFFFGAFVALIWPVSLPVTYALGKGSTSRLLYTPPRFREQKQKEMIRQRDARIRELELEAGFLAEVQSPPPERDPGPFVGSVVRHGGQIHDDRYQTGRS